MTLLVTGLLLWAVVHLAPSVGRSPRQAVIDRIGFDAYRGVFSLLILSSIALMVFGWRSASPEHIYATPVAMRTGAMLLIGVGFLFLGASGRPSRLGRVVRHPQLTGVLCWCIAHLMANGDSRSLLLFGGLASWCVLEMIVINRRDGTWEQQDAPPIQHDLLGAVISLAIMAALMWMHPWLSGMPLF